MRLTPLLLACAFLAPLAVAHAGEPCGEDPMVCVRHIVENAKTRGWLGIQFDGDAYGEPSLAYVVPGSPAEKAGLEPGDRLLQLNGVAYFAGNQEALKEQYEGFLPGKTITLIVDRAGEKVTVHAELVPVPESIVAQWVGQHMMEHMHQGEAEAAADPAGETPEKAPGGDD